MLINVIMPTIVGILTFISMINTTFKSLKADCCHFAFISMIKTSEFESKKKSIFQHLELLLAVEISSSFELSMKNVL